MKLIKINDNVVNLKYIQRAVLSYQGVAMFFEGNDTSGAHDLYNLSKEDLFRGIELAQAHFAAYRDDFYFDCDEALSQEKAQYHPPGASGVDE